MALDSFYYENILDKTLNNYRQIIEEGIEKAVEQLKGYFKKLEITYFLEAQQLFLKLKE